MQLITNPNVVKVAQKYNRTGAQVLLRWVVQQGLRRYQSRVWLPWHGHLLCGRVCTAVIPKSLSPERLKENSAIFDFKLDQDDEQALAELEDGHHYCWNPDQVD